MLEAKIILNNSFDIMSGYSSKTELEGFIQSQCHSLMLSAIRLSFRYTNG